MHIDLPNVKYEDFMSVMKLLYGAKIIVYHNQWGIKYIAEYFSIEPLVEFFGGSLSQATFQLPLKDLMKKVSLCYLLNFIIL